MHNDMWSENDHILELCDWILLGPYAPRELQNSEIVNGWDIGFSLYAALLLIIQVPYFGDKQRWMERGESILVDIQAKSIHQSI